MSKESSPADATPMPRATAWALRYWRWLTQRERLRLQLDASRPQADVPRWLIAKQYAAPSNEFHG